MENSQDHYRTLLEYAFRVLGRRAHTTHELQKKLSQRKEYTPQEGERVMARLLELKLLNDRSFVEQSFEQALRIRHDGAQKTIYKLLKKGIPFKQAQAIWEEQRDPTLEREAAKQALEKILHRLRDEPLQSRYLKASQRLAAKGFPPELIFELVRAQKSGYDEDSQDQYNKVGY